MKILIAGGLFHPDQLAESQRRFPDNPFPPSQAEFFYVRSLRKLGHQVEVFHWNAPALLGKVGTLRFTSARVTFSKLLAAFSHRLPRLSPDYHLRNRNLIEQVRRFQPDAILIIGGHRLIFPDTLAEIKRSYGTKLLYGMGDSPIVFLGQIERQSTPLYDLVLVNDYYHGIQLLELGAPRMECLPFSACDPDFHKPYPLTDAERAEFACNVGFVGTLIPPNLYSQRASALEAVREFGLGVWSVHEVPPTLRPHYRGGALGEQTFKAICGAKMQLNPNSNFMRYGGNMRLFETAGCGVFQITNDTPGAAAWFTLGEHLITYRDSDDLRRLTGHYLEHEAERTQIAAAGQAHAYAHHTYDQRMARLVELIATIK